MNELTLIYFEGCPNASKARALLTAAGRPFTEVLQDTLPEGHPKKGYTSPSILEGDRVIYGMKSDEEGCSIGGWDEQQILEEITTTN